MNIKILGSGCANCQRLERFVREVVAELGMEATIEKVTDYSAILSYGIMRTPGLVVDGTVKAAGHVPGKPELRQLLAGESGRPA